MIVVPNYAFEWLYTCAQIELMSADVPITVYPKDKKRKPKKSEMEKLKREWEAKQKEQKVNINDFLRGDRETMDKLSKTT